MDIQTVKKLKTTYLVNGSVAIPECPGNIDYQNIQKWVVNGGVIEQEFSLQELKIKKIQQIKSLRDSLNISPCLDHQANIISDSTGNVLQTKSYFKFYVNRHPSNPLSDPSVILQQAQIQPIAYATYKPNGDSVTVSIDSEVALSIITHLTSRNNQNYSLCRAKEKTILSCTTIEELNAIDTTTLV